jgi:hypothetical protein
MSVKITVSYSEEQELQNVIKLLSPITHHIKRRKKAIGEFKVADITVRQ